MDDEVMNTGRCRKGGQIRGDTLARMKKNSGRKDYAGAHSYPYGVCVCVIDQTKARNPFILAFAGLIAYFTLEERMEIFPLSR